MNLLLVTFALRNQTRDYNSFFVALRGNALNWWHFIEQTCVLTTNYDVEEFTHLLAPHIEQTDSILVVKMTPHQYQGWLPPVAWEGLNQMSENTKPVAHTLTIPPPPRR
jgi:hypothetical protein